MFLFVFLFSQLCEGFVSFASLTNHQVQCHGLAPEFIEVRDEAIPQVGQMPSADEAEVSQVVDRRYQSVNPCCYGQICPQGTNDREVGSDCLIY